MVAPAGTWDVEVGLAQWGLTNSSFPFANEAVRYFMFGRYEKYVHKKEDPLIDFIQLCTYI